MPETPAERAAARTRPDRGAPDPVRDADAAGQDVAGIASGHHVRVLPWTVDGKMSVLSTSGPGSFLSRLADSLEDTRLDAGHEVLRQGCAVLADPLSPYGEVRYAGVRLAECLRDALGIAESRGLRLPEPGDVPDEGGDGAERHGGRHR